LKHFTSPDFWHLFSKLPAEIQKLARENYELLKDNPHHPSLHLKKARGYWSVRVGLGYRALGKQVDDGILWGWIGAHSEYTKILSS
jgi:mRNA-degrading endonuclease RelE of RelBE toxin-antitoxin system